MELFIRINYFYFACNLLGTCILFSNDPHSHEQLFLRIFIQCFYGFTYGTIKKNSQFSDGKLRMTPSCRLIFKLTGDSKLERGSLCINWINHEPHATIDILLIVNSKKRRFV